MARAGHGMRNRDSRAFHPPLCGKKRKSGGPGYFSGHDSEGKAKGIPGEKELVVKDIIELIVDAIGN